MKKNFLTIGVLTLLSSCSVNQKYVNMSPKEQAKVRPLEWTPAMPKEVRVQKYDDISIYRLDKVQLQKIIEAKQKKFVYACLYLYYCKPCWEKMSDIIQLQKKNEETVETILIDADNWADTHYLKKKLFEKSVYFPTFILDESVYGNEYRALYRFQKFQNEIAPNRSDLIGTPLNVILNSKLETLYASNKPMTQAILDSVMQARPQ